jgi:hypothetical protein
VSDEQPAVEVVTTPDTVQVTVQPAPTPVTVKVTTEPAEVAHEQPVPIAAHEVDFYPPHPPRSETTEYNQTHHLLVNVLDTPCRICGVRKSTLGDPAQNPYKATALETHHYPVQREFTDAVDWRKVARDFTQVVDQKSLLLFVDSPANMWVLCSHCHRDSKAGVHHAVVADWIIHRYLFDGYILTDSADHAAADLAIDQAIVDQLVPLAQRI